MWKLMQHVVWLLVFAVDLRSCSPDVFIHCTVTQTSNGTFYSLPEYPGEDCHYSWKRNGTVIANTKDKDKQVMTSSKTTLQTRECHEDIEYTGECSGPEHIASCTTNCTDNPGLQKDNESPANHWIIPVVIFSALAVIVVVLCIIYRHKICRRLSNLRRDHQPEDII